MSVLQRCLSYRVVRLTEVSVLLRCPSYGGVRFTEVSIKRELTVSVKKIYTMFYEISKRKVALIQELPSLLRPQPVCGGRILRLQSPPLVFQKCNRPFYRYGGRIELIRFKEYYRMPRGHEHISFVFSSAFRDIFS